MIGQRFRNVMAALALAFVGMIALAGPAAAQLCQGQFTDISFGTINPTTGFASDAAGTLSLQCQGTPNATARVCPSIGSGQAGDAGNATARYLSSGANNLLFSIFQDAARTIPWGSYTWAYAAQAPSPQFDIPLGPTGQATRTYSVYGRIFAGQPGAAIGAYSSNFNGVQVLIASALSTVGGCAIISGLGGRRSNFVVNATVSRTCSLTTTPLNFGTIGALTAALDGSAQLRVTCTVGTPYSIGLNGGASGATSPTLRKMTNATPSTVTYGLYGDAARTQPWFNTNAFFQGGGTGNGLTQTLNVFGRIPVQATPPPGTYTDSVVVVVTY